jgi:uncharacterized protein (TIGR02145 family)
MNRFILSLGLLFILMNLNAQDYMVSFGVLGQSGTPDSVWVENQDRYTTLDLRGEDILHLVRTISGIDEAILSENLVKVYPNPFKERASIELYNPKDGRVGVIISDITGKLIESQEYHMQQGYNSLALSGLSKGTYVLKIQGEDFYYSALLFSPFSSGRHTNMHLTQNQGAFAYNNMHSDLLNNNQLKSAISSEEIIQMQYIDGELLVLTAYLNTKSSEAQLLPTDNHQLLFDFSSVAGFYANDLISLAGSPIQFTDTSNNNPTSWVWDFGDGNESVLQNPSNTYNREGYYTVSLTASNEYGTSMETKTDYITVNPLAPLVEFTAIPTEITKEESVQFSDQSVNYPTSWLWDFGDGLSSTDENPLHTFTNVGTYTVALTASNSAGADAETKTDYITVKPFVPVAEFAGIPMEITREETVQFTDQSLNDPENWSWDFGDGSSSTEENPLHAFALAGTYTVSLIVGNSAGDDTETKTDYITVNPFVPVAEFSAVPEAITMGESVQFTDQSLNDPNSWTWDFGDGNSSTQENPSHTYEIAGCYTVTLTASNISGSDDEIKTDYITVYPHVPVCEYSGTPRLLSVGGSVQFTDESLNDPANWSWNFGDGSSSTQENPSHTYTSSGTFTVTLNVSNAGGSDSETKTAYITVNPLTPVTDFSATPRVLTVGSSVQFTDESSNVPTSWSWNFGDGSSSTQKNPSHTYGTSGTFTVTLNATNSAGSDAETKTGYITVNPRVPVADFSGTPRSILEGQSVEFTDESDYVPTSWSWTFGDGGSSSLENPSHTYTSTGTFTVSLTATNSAGSDGVTKTSYITVDYNAPVAEFSGTPLSILEAESVQFTDLSTNSPSSWSWNFGDSNSSTLENPSHIYATAGTYTVTLTATNSAGSDIETKIDYITVDPDIVGTVSDIDGNTYMTIEIGSQTWMAENLKTSRYADATSIPHVENTTAWDALTANDPAYCWFNGSSGNAAIYGNLYNWPAAMNGAASTDANPSGVQGVCPAGWHIPSDSEWKEMEIYLGMSSSAADELDFRGSDEGGKLKEVGLEHWWSPNTGATNESGFTALPGGFRRDDASFYGQGIFADIWTATQASDTSTIRRYLPYNEARIFRGPLHKNYGFSVRCVKD